GDSPDGLRTGANSPQPTNPRAQDSIPSSATSPPPSKRSASRTRSGLGNHLPQMPEQGSAKALRHSGNAGTGSGPLAQRRTDSGATGWSSGKTLALVPAAAGCHGFIARLAHRDCDRLGGHFLAMAAG